MAMMERDQKRLQEQVAERLDGAILDLQVCIVEASEAGLEGLFVDLLLTAKNAAIDAIRRLDED